MATEMMGLITGTYGGSAKILKPGGLTCDNSYVAHGGMWNSLQAELQSGPDVCVFRKLQSMASRHYRGTNAQAHQCRHSQ